MATAKDTSTFFLEADTKQFDSVLKLYPQAIKLKAEQKTKKPEELIKLDNWWVRTPLQGENAAVACQWTCIVCVSVQTDLIATSLADCISLVRGRLIKITTSRGIDVNLTRSFFLKPVGKISPRSGIIKWWLSLCIMTCFNVFALMLMNAILLITWILWINNRHDIVGHLSFNL